MGIAYILWYFWYIFPVFGMLYHEKSGNPVLDRQIVGADFRSFAFKRIMNIAPKVEKRNSL
jgi:hypothetical protein